MTEPLASGSYLAISHASLDGPPADVVAAHRERYQNAAVPVAFRDRDAIARFFGGFELVDPGLVLVLYGTAWYAPPIGFVSDAALLYFGSSMLLAAYRGYAGCEVLSISNWVLHRDDQIGCVLFDPVDRLEGRRSG